MLKATSTEACKFAEFTLKEFEDISRSVEVNQEIMNPEPKLDRSMRILPDVDEALCVYQHRYEDLKTEKTGLHC
jgi:hypothetical protein